MHRRIGLAVLAAVLSLALSTAASAASKKNDPVVTSTVTTQTTSINNGGGTPSCGASCDQSHNPTDYTKPCDPVPGNGCHLLPATPCERGHGGTEIGNKHCGPDLTILKEQESFQTSASPQGQFTHGSLTAPLSTDVYYRITVTNLTSTDYTLLASDLVCATNQNTHDLVPSGSVSQLLSAGGSVVYTCDVDANPGQPGMSGQAPYTLTNTVNVTATPVGGGSDVLLTDTVTASLT
jgi:hypothetical protein